MRPLKDPISTAKVTKTRQIDLNYEGNIGVRQPVDNETFYTPQPVTPTIPDELIKSRLNVDTSYLKNVNGLGQQLPKTPLQPKSPTYAEAGAASGNTTPTAPTQSETSTSEPVDSYEQWLQKNSETYKKTYDDTVAAIDKNAEAAKQAAENQRAQAEQNAETERQRASVDARSSYAQNLAQYGKVGEQMQSMGLSGSGYGEYLNSQAYAQQRAEQQNANAAATAAKRDAQYTADQTTLAAEQQANSDKLNAMLSYEQNINQNAGELAKYREQKESERKNAYAELLSYANNGSYTSEQLKKLAENYGLSETDVASLTDAADKYKQSKYSENYATAIDNINTYGSELEADYLDNLLELDYISKEQYDSLKTKYNNKVALESKQKIEEGMQSGDYSTIEATLENADKLYSEKKISQEEYQDIYGRGQEAAVSGIVGRDYGGDYAGSINDINEANKELDDMYAAGKLSKSKYDSLKTKLNEKNAKGVTNYVQGLGSGRKNDDIDVTIGQGSRNKKIEYDLLCGDEVTDPNAKETLNKYATGSTSAPSNGTLVVYGGKMYIYTKKGWRNVISDHSKVKDAIADYLKHNKK